MITIGTSEIESPFVGVARSFTPGYTVTRGAGIWSPSIATCTEETLVLPPVLWQLCSMKIESIHFAIAGIASRGLLPRRPRRRIRHAGRGVR